MTHAGFTSPRLVQMRLALDEAVLSTREKRAAEKALDQVEADWYVQHREAYENGVAARDEEHDVVMAATAQFLEQVRAATDDVRKGRRDADDARKWLRDVHADFTSLTEAHQGVSASDDRLAEFVAMSPDAYQAEQFDRFPSLENTAPTIASLTANHGQGRTRMLSREQIDADQDALARELPSSFRR